ncbi:hypothetical protein O9X98_10930 [Agrobacterium salinitolerans]|nr:hypothetical protein [Agrobacterium salinitolerans]
MPKPKMPKPWKAGSRKGTYFRPLPHGLLIYDPSAERFHLEVKRGTSARICDHWGPWQGVLEDEAEIIVKTEALYADLERGGWTTMPYRDPQGEIRTHEANTPHMVAALARIPRSTLIPWVLLHMLDSDRAAKGKAVSSGVLRTGGHDFHVEQYGNLWGAIPADRMLLTVQNPGQSKRAVGGKRLDLDIHQLDALIHFLIDARAGMAPEETVEAIQKPIRHGIEGEAPANRLARMQQHAMIVHAILGELEHATPERLETVLAMTQMINAGDMTVDVIYADPNEAEGNIH